MLHSMNHKNVTLPAVRTGPTGRVVSLRKVRLLRGVRSQQPAGINIMHIMQREPDAWAIQNQAAATTEGRLFASAARCSREARLSNMKRFSHPCKNTQFIDHKNDRTAKLFRIVTLHGCRKHGGLLERHFGMRAFCAVRALGAQRSSNMRVVRREIVGRAEENPAMKPSTTPNGAIWSSWSGAAQHQAGEDPAMRSPNAPDGRREASGPTRQIPLRSNCRRRPSHPAAWGSKL